MYNAYIDKVLHAPSEHNEARRRFLREDAPIHFDRLEKLISQYGKNGFAVGASLTWADLAVFDIASTISELDAKALEKFPRVLGVKKSVEANVRVAEYLRNCPKCDF
jgi:glutathione S-transferase